MRSNALDERNGAQLIAESLASLRRMDQTILVICGPWGVYSATMPAVIRNRLRHLPNELFDRYVEFARRNAQVIDPDLMLQKLVIFDFVWPLVESRQHGTLLEVGCGTGVHSALLSEFGAVSATELANPGSFVGADRDVADCRERVMRELARRPIAFAHNDGHTLPFEDSYFDVVFHNSVIEHVPRPVDLNREVFRVLRPGGICVCITGTALLCLFRLVRDYLPLLLPKVARELLREALASDDGTLVQRRIRAACGPSGRVARRRRSLSARELRGLYSRFRHFVESPAYNRIVMEEAAKKVGLEADALIEGCRQHLDASWLNRLLYAVTPRTHGQNYVDVWDEMWQWRLSQWRRSFLDAGYQVERAFPYRFHHVFEPSPNLALNAAVYHRAAGLIHRAIAGGHMPPSLGSEFVMVARKP